MTINSRSLLLAKSERRSIGPGQFLWSSGFSDFLTYAALRSRGFALRKTAGFLTEAIETICLALIAGHASFKVGLALALANLFLGSLAQGLLLSARVNLFSVKKVSIKALQFLLPFFAMVIYALALSVSQISIFTGDPLIIFLVVTRISSSLLQVALETQTAEYNFQRRVYISPWVSYLSVAFVAVIGALSVSFPSMIGLFCLVASSSLAKVVSCVIFFKQTKKAMLERPLQNNSVPSSKSSVNSTIERTMLIVSGLIVSIIPVFYLDRGTLQFFSLVLVIKSISIAFVERPFRTVHVEIVNAAQFQQWDFLASVLAKATKASLGIFALISATSLLVSLAVGETFVSVCVVWALLFALNSAMSLRLMTVGVDDEVSRVILAVRSLVVFSCYLLNQVAEDRVGENLLLIMVFGELAIITMLVRHYFVVNLPQKLEFKFQVDAGTVPSIRQSSVQNFLNCLKIIGPHLDRLGIFHDLILVNVRSPIRSATKARSFIEDMTGCLRAADHVIALNSTQFILWAPGSVTCDPIKARLLKRFPLIIDRISSLDRRSFFALICSSAPASIKFGSAEIMGHTYSLLAALELSLKSRLITSHEGAWWTMNSSGLWHSLAGKATAAQNRIFQKITSDAMKDIFIAPGRNKSYRSRAVSSWVLNPAGKVLAIYSAKTLDSHVLDALRSIHSDMLSERVHAITRNQTVSPTEFYMLERIWLELSKRLSINVSVAEVKSSKSDVIPVAFTGNGSGAEFGLYITNKEMSQVLGKTKTKS